MSWYINVLSIFYALYGQFLIIPYTVIVYFHNFSIFPTSNIVLCTVRTQTVFIQDSVLMVSLTTQFYCCCYFNFFASPHKTKTSTRTAKQKPKNNYKNTKHSHKLQNMSDWKQTTEVKKTPMISMPMQLEMKIRLGDLWWPVIQRNLK